jgi:hypothetical protein
MVAERYKSTIEELTGCKVIAFLSQAHLDPDITVEMFFIDGPLPGFGAARTSAKSPGGRRGAASTVRLRAGLSQWCGSSPSCSASATPAHHAGRDAPSDNAVSACSRSAPCPSLPRPTSETSQWPGATLYTCSERPPAGEPTIHSPGPRTSTTSSLPEEAPSVCRGMIVDNRVLGGAWSRP